MPIDSSAVKHWDPSQFLQGRASHKYSVIVLHQPIEDVLRFAAICKGASQVIAADGAANRLYDLQSGLQVDQSILPDFVIGDFDSIRPEVKDFFEAREETKLVHSSDLYSTDFTKCLRFVAQCRKESSIQQRGPPSASPNWSTIAFGGLGGRVDQAFAQIHQLYMAAENSDLRSGDLYLVTPSSIVFVLDPGQNIIKTPMGPGKFAESVGIIPVGRPAVITLKGFEWDVEDWRTSFGTQVSTSNHLRADEVTVTADVRVLFTLDLAARGS